MVLTSPFTMDIVIIHFWYEELMNIPWRTNVFCWLC